MTNTLLIAIAVMVLITMICTIVTVVIATKETKSEKVVSKVLKITGVILLILALIGAAIGVSSLKDEDKTSKTESVTLETAGFNNLSLDEYLELVKGTEKSIVLVARPTCSFCEQFTPVLKKAMDDMKLTINYIDTDKFSESDWNKFNNSLTFLSTEEWGTPLVLIVQNGEAVAENQGYVELNAITEFFKSNGLEK